MNVLVLGGTGTVGSQVVRALLERGGCTVTATSRSGVGPKGGVRWIAADLERPSSLAAAFEGQDRVFLLTPLHPRETELGMRAVVAAENAGVSRIVLHSIFRAERSPHVPHFASKVRLLNAIRESEIPRIALKCNSYFQNDLGLLDTMRQHGVYGMPLGSIGVSRVDVRDIGDAAANALLDPGHEGMEVPLNGSEALTGQQVAAAWSRHLGRDVAYGGDDVEAWCRVVEGLMPMWMIQDLAAMARIFVDEGFSGTEEDMASQSHLLGHAPRTFADFVAETATGLDGP